MLLGGALAGPEVARIVGIHSVGDVGEAELRAERSHDGEQLIFAVEAAVGVVALVFGAIEFAGCDDAQGHAEGRGEGLRLLEIAAREAGRIGEHGEHAVAQDAMGGCGEKGGIDASRIRDHQRRRCA